MVNDESVPEMSLVSLRTPSFPSPDSPLSPTVPTLYLPDRPRPKVITTQRPWSLPTPTYPFSTPFSFTGRGRQTFSLPGSCPGVWTRAFVYVCVSKHIDTRVCDVCVCMCVLVCRVVWEGMRSQSLFRL